MSNERAALISAVIVGCIIGAFNSARAKKEKDRFINAINDENLREAFECEFREMTNKQFQKDMNDIEARINAMLEDILKSEQERKDALEKTRKEWNDANKLNKEEL